MLFYLKPVPMTLTIDHKKVLRDLFNPPSHPVIIEVPSFNYLKVDGFGNPNTNPFFQEATNLLYALSYTLRFALKASQDIAYTVLPLEGLWWADDHNSFLNRNKDDWMWTLMIMQPEFVTADMVESARAEAVKKKKLNAEIPSLARFEPYQAGTCVTLMHIGSYDNETENIAWMHRHAAEQGYQLHGLHQEIYLSDPRKTPPEKMKTVLRQPIRRHEA